MKHLLIILSFLLLSSPVIGQSEKPKAIIIDTGSLGEISKTRIKILDKTLESKLDDYFAIVPKEIFEEAKEKAFEELDYDKCTEDQCIMKIQEILQVENAFKMELTHEDGNTQISLTWSTLDQKRVEQNYCEGCNTKEMINTIGGLVEALMGKKNTADEEAWDDIKNSSNPTDFRLFIQLFPNSQLVNTANFKLDRLKREQTEKYELAETVEKRQKGVLYGYSNFFLSGSGWCSKEVESCTRIRKEHGGGEYKGQIKNWRPDGQGTFMFHCQLFINDCNGEKVIGEWKYGKPYNAIWYNRNGSIFAKYIKGSTQIKP